MPRLGDGSVIPSHFKLSMPNYRGDAFSNVQLRFGEVQEIIYPDDDKSVTKKFIEYDVYVQERSQHSGNGRLYKRCVMMNPFGGVADHATVTLRASHSIKDPKNNRRGHGSKVLLLCINGEMNNAVILGGLHDQDDTSEQNASDDKHHLNALFNGVAFSVNDDGEFSVTFNGPTDIDGKLRSGVDSSTAGASITFTKDGKIKILENKALEIGQATDHFILGDTYRKGESSMNQDLQTGLQNVATKLTAAAAQIALAGGSVAGPFLASTAGPPLVSASAQLLSAVADLNKMAASLQKFEANASKYLSKNNKTD